MQSVSSISVKLSIFNIYLFIDIIQYLLHSVHWNSSAHTIGVLNCDIVRGGRLSIIYDAAEMRTHRRTHAAAAGCRQLRQWLLQPSVHCSVLTSARHLATNKSCLGTLYMTGLLHEGKFHVRNLLEPAIFDSLPWAYVMCNWAQILLHMRHWPSQ